MLGFVIGFSSAIVLLALVIGFKVRRWRRRRGGRGARHRGVVMRVLSKLDATPQQESELLDTLDGLSEALDALRVDAAAARADIAAALRDDGLDPSQLEAMAVDRRSALEQAVTAVRDALGRVHATLDVTQRAALAELVERGPRAWRRACVRPSTA